MKQTEIIMGMPITIEIVDKSSSQYFKVLFDYFKSIDARFSTYKKNSEISQINNGLPSSRWSPQMKTVLDLCEQTRKDTMGYFNIEHNNKLDPSGLVKGWAIANAAKMLLEFKVSNFYVEAGGDIQVNGQDQAHKNWVVGIRNPFSTNEIIKTVALNKQGIATSGTYIRGQHIYDPHKPEYPIKNVSSLTVIAPSIYDADRFATAAFAMGIKGIDFIESIPSLEGYMVTSDKVATYTSGFESYVLDD